MVTVLFLVKSTSSAVNNGLGLAVNPYINKLLIFLCPRQPFKVINLISASKSKINKISSLILERLFTFPLIN